MKSRHEHEHVTWTQTLVLMKRESLGFIENIPEDIVQLILVLTYKVFSFELLTKHQSKDIELLIFRLWWQPTVDHR